MISFRKAVVSSRESALIGLLLVLGGLTGARDVVGLVAPPSASLYFILVLFVGVVTRIVLQERRIGSIAPLPQVAGLFNPFGGVEIDSGALWPRSAEAIELAERIRGSVNSHLILSGPSGAGKSTLVRKLVVPLIDQDFRIQIFSHYDSIVLQVIESLDADERLLARQRTLCGRYAEFVSDNRCLPGEIFDADFPESHETVCHLWEDIAAFFDAAGEGNSTCFMFDQIERYLQGLEAAQASENNLNGYELFLFMRFLRWCLKSKSSRSVFIIRSDNLYESIDFLDAVVAAEHRVGQVDYILCHGINTTTAPQGVRAIRDAFRALGLGAVETDRFDHVCRLESRAASNTFMTQMVGYVVENFYNTDPGVRLLLKKEGEREIAIRQFFRHFLNDFVRRAESADPLDLIKATLFSIATENVVSGRGATLERISALSHMPREVVDEAVQFSKSTGLLVEELAEEEITYRFVHDIVSDYVLENEQFTMHPVLKDAIRALSERHVPTRNLTSVRRYTSLVTDLWEDPNAGLFAIWGFVLFGALKLKFVPFCEWSWRWASGAFGRESCATVMSYYLAVYILHIVWLIFIYHIHREYLRVVLRSSILRAISGLMPVIGAVLAIYLSQSPSLFVIPIVSVGLMMGALLLIGVADGSFVGADAPVRRNWGIRTIMNMVITSGFSLVTWLVLWRDPQASAFWQHTASILGGAVGAPMLSAQTLATVWIYVASLIMIYFWLHIRPEQQSHVASAARLAAFDRARSEANV